MSVLANAQNRPDAGVAWFSRPEEERIHSFPLPGEKKGKFGSTAIYYPRRPIENPGRWFAAHAAKLRSLLRAEGM